MIDVSVRDQDRVDPSDSRIPERFADQIDAPLGGGEASGVYEYRPPVGCFEDHGLPMTDGEHRHGQAILVMRRFVERYAQSYGDPCRHDQREVNAAHSASEEGDPKEAERIESDDPPKGRTGNERVPPA